MGFKGMLGVKGEFGEFFLVFVVFIFFVKLMVNEKGLVFFWCLVRKNNGY